MSKHVRTVPILRLPELLSATPASVLSNMIVLPGAPLWQHAVASLLLMLAGYLLSVVVALPIGFVMGASHRSAR